ncbi:isoleucine--tRNA ligase [bacterium]|nr:MAG: isoleucine--tRNA ligase [bacterium]
MATEATKRPDYRKTLNLPQTEFPMKADLPQREPARIAWWAERRTYERRLEANAGAQPWILHDGPPYANGGLHMGHFLNKVLKDIFVKVHLLDGLAARFVPGWDMHGLPIEIETLKHLGVHFRSVPPAELREKCRERALHWLGVQRDLFMRMGCFGLWETPYRTIDPSFEGTIVDALAELAQQKYLYKGLRSTYWCPTDETALAEAEIEYRDHVSPSVYVRFPTDAAQRDDLLARFDGGAEEAGELPLAVLCWTTTPWSLPGTVGVAFNPAAEYGLFRFRHPGGGEELLIFATALLESVLALVPGTTARTLATTTGERLVGGIVRHPFMDFSVRLVDAPYVELSTGTGAVTTAPGHGPEDFDTGVRCGLPIITPVDESGRFTAEAGPFQGLHVLRDANARIIEHLRASGMLYFQLDYEHSYAHCWRCHNPVIFRATSQWFMALDVNHLRRRITDQVSGVAWHPAWGEERMRQMIENHPDWCLSRQRTWGTPIPAFDCGECGKEILDARVARHIANLFREHGAVIWWTWEAERLLPADFHCPHCGSAKLTKEMNIVDIWFESGVTHLAVLGSRELPWPADVYLEGSDQYRGWFRSNLITAVAIKGAPPYREVVSTGWVVDPDGRAMHKSAGNYIAADGAMNTYGADVMRLWVASVDYEADVRVGTSILANVGEVYRNLRNRVRFILGNLFDFTPEAVVAPGALQPLDRLAVAAANALADRCAAAYREYRLHDVYLALSAFVNEDLSAFYLDALKDRLYSSAAGSPQRRSAQTALWHIAKTLLALYAPVLSFTAEEAWQSVPAALRADADSVFFLMLAQAHPAPAEAELALWERLKSLRSQVKAQSEVEGKDFELRAVVRADAQSMDALRGLGDDLREALVLSALELESGAEGVQLTLARADGAKCARCWKYRELGVDANYPLICAPCAEVVRSLEG